jgi:hypothetical protein
VVTSASIERACTACSRWLAARDTPESALLDLERGVDGAERRAEEWAARILGEQEADGSWGGDLLRTAEALLVVEELRPAGGTAGDAAVHRGFDWLRSRRGEAGSWVEGCDPERHRRGLCHHFLSGFFSPGPPDERLAPGHLASGAPLTSEAELRFVASVVALRCLLKAAGAAGDVNLHLGGLRQVVRLWADDRPEELSGTALFAAIDALAASGAAGDRASAEHGLRVAGSRQRGDGSWVDADAFLALEVVGRALDAGLAPDALRATLWHGARLLVATQQADGSWGTPYGPRRALIAWRTFRRVDPESAART